MKINQGENVMLSREDFRRIACKVLEDERGDIPEGMDTLIQLVIMAEAASTLHRIEDKLFDEEEAEE